MNRRNFIKKVLCATGVVYLSSGLTACKTAVDKLTQNNVTGLFKHGVASGDPLADRVIIWTRITVDSASNITEAHSAHVRWQVATDIHFTNIVVDGEGDTTADRDFTLKVDVLGLLPNTRYYYRFIHNGLTSVVGATKTLAIGNTLAAVKLIVVTCSKYDAGFYYVYREALKEKECDAVIHLGDFIYEYAAGGEVLHGDGNLSGEGEYAADAGPRLGRVVEPTHTIVSLADYRMRHAQNKTDIDLQNLHAALPFICVWDDHDIADNAWKAGAENHLPKEGAYADRVTAAMKAYAEWTPIRPPTDINVKTIVRNFKFGDLVNLMMIESRVIARDKQLDYNDFTAADGTFDAAGFKAAWLDKGRRLIGDEQLYWLDQQLADSSTWKVLGQQILMGKQFFPKPILQKEISIFDYIALAKLAKQAQTAPQTLTLQQSTYLSANKHFLDEPFLPYNLDTWDGYPIERSKLLSLVAKHNSNFVVLAGDSHNAWANNLFYETETDATPVGVEFGTTSITSPGFEVDLALDTDTKASDMEAAFYKLLTDNVFCNLNQRGYLTTSYTRDYVEANFVFVNSVKETSYTVREDRNKVIRVVAGAKSLPMRS